MDSYIESMEKQIRTFMKEFEEKIERKSELKDGSPLFSIKEAEKGTEVKIPFFSRFNKKRRLVALAGTLAISSAVLYATNSNNIVHRQNSVSEGQSITLIFPVETAPKISEPKKEKGQEKNIYIAKPGDNMESFARKYIDPIKDKEVMEEFYRVNGKEPLSPKWVNPNGTPKLFAKPLSKNPNFSKVGDAWIITPLIEKGYKKQAGATKLDINLSIQTSSKSLEEKISLYENSYTKEELNAIIKIKNNYNGRSFDKIAEEIKVKSNMNLAENSLEKILKGIISLKATDQDYRGLGRINFDYRLADNEMKTEMTRMYSDSDKNLNYISEELSKKYGMNVSASTISKYARNELKVKNRREARGMHASAMDNAQV